METLLRMAGISKSFPGVNALVGVDFELQRGEVHALVGENGAGKSTLMKILAGVYRADEGEIWLKGRKLTAADPRAMIDAGVSVIYQELNLVPYLSVAENILLGREPRRPGGLIDWRRMRREVEALLAPFNLSLDPRTKVSRIGPAYQQVVEIAKALSLKADIIVMDEPTAPLTGSEVGKLFEIIRNLKAGGVSVAYISHRLEELHEVADRVTVLRDGRKIITAPLSSLTVDDIIRTMVGRQLTEQYVKAGSPSSEEILRVEGLSKQGVCSDVAFSVHKGEVLGFAGLVGAGRTEIMQLIYGYRRKDAGRIFIKGKEVKIRRTRDAVRHGIALIPEERKRQGLILGLSVLDNSALTIFDLHHRAGFIRWREIRPACPSDGEQPWHQDPVPSPDGSQPLRRESAESGSVEVVRTPLRRVHLRRANPRHRRRGQGGDLQAHGKPREGGGRHHHGLLGAPGGHERSEPHRRGVWRPHRERVPAGGSLRRGSDELRPGIRGEAVTVTSAVTKGVFE